MKLQFLQAPPLTKHLAVPLLSLVLTAGCSSGNDSSDNTAEVQPQSVDETNTGTTAPSSVGTDNDTGIDNDAAPNDDIDSNNPTLDSSITDDTTEDTLATDDTDSMDTTDNNSNPNMPDGITTFPACESDATDPDGDGFGFENDMSCLVATMNSTEADEQNADGTIADGIITLPVCESDATDPDGDGFGFENDVSCIVATMDDTESGGLNADDTITDGIITFPVCESDATDPDGDGFGFENDVSCIIATMDDTASGESNSEDLVADGITTFPACESTDTDTDGDGYGFENDLSCVVATMVDTDSNETNAANQPTDDYTTEQGMESNSAELASSPYFEGFDQPLPTFSQQDRTSDGATSEFTYGDGFAVVRVDSTTEGRERARFTPRGRFDSFSVVMSIEPGSVALGDGRVQAGVSGFMFNDTTSEPVGGGNCYAGDVGVQVIKRLYADGKPAFVLNSYRETQSECGLTEETYIFDGMGYVVLETPAGLGESHRIGIDIDRANKLLTISIDDEVFTYPLLTDVFPPGNPFSSFETRVERGPGTAIVRFDEIRAGDQTYNFTDSEQLGRYTFWDAGDPGTSISYPNGELRLESAWDSNSRGENRLAVTGHDTRYISAQMRLSSDSIAAGGGDVIARTAGSMYYASDTPGDRRALHQVFAVTEIRVLESGATEARYCAWQSLDDSFSESISLVNSESESGCNSFALTPVLDQNYTLATWMDDANRRIVFSIDGEEHFHNVEGPVSIGDELFEMRIQSRANGEGSKAVVFADNLRSLPEAVR